MARLLSFPFNPGVVDITPISGPMARSSGSNTSSDGSEQTFDSVGDVVALRLSFNVKRKGLARQERGLFTGLHGGANAIRLSFFDPDVIMPAEAGLDVAAHLDWTDLDALNWSNGQPWSNGQGWAQSAPEISVASASAINTGIVTLPDSFWGHRLDLGSYFGFFPFHFGLYMVTEVIDDGQYRIWPRLRKALTTDDFATLFPVIAMRPLSRDSAKYGRGLSVTNAASIDLVEVIDPYVRSDFTD